MRSKREEIGDVVLSKKFDMDSCEGFKDNYK